MLERMKTVVDEIEAAKAPWITGVQSDSRRGLKRIQYKALGTYQIQ